MPNPPPAPPAASAAITVHRTDSGQFVLTHPSGATVLGDSLDAAWSALAEQLAAGPDAEPQADRPTQRPAPARPRWLMPLLLALPFVWIALGSIQAELSGVEADAPQADIERRIGALEAELGQLGSAVDRLRKAPAPTPAAPTPAAPTPAAPIPGPEGSPAAVPGQPR